MKTGEEASADEQSAEPVGPSRYRSKLVVELEGDQMALIQKALDKARKETGLRDRAQLLEHMARAYLCHEESPGMSDTRAAAFRITIYHNPESRATYVETPTGRQYVSERVLEQGMCDAQILDLQEPCACKPGSVDPAEVKSDPVRDCALNCGKDDRSGPRIRRAISPRLRRRVLERQGHRCACCGRMLYLQIHHLDPVAKGGKNIGARLVGLCSACHRAVHRGRLLVDGDAGSLVFRNNKGELLKPYA